MSLITRCPACNTMFKVVPDQLRVSDGWVRCGQCDEVFDANAHLHSEAVAPQPEPEKPAAYDWGTIVQSSEATVAEPEPQYSPEPLPELHADPEPLANVEPIAEDPFLALSPQELGGTSPVAVADEEVLALHAEPLAVEEPAPRYVQSANPVLASVEEAAAISFMHGKQQSKARSSRAAGVLVALGCVVLVGVLLLQWLLHDRDRIAATDAGARQAMQVMCDVLGCKIAPLRQIESLVIDSSSFAKVRSDVYRLGFTLKNTAPIALAVPSLELTMTDMQDQALVRRVLSPAELESKSGNIPAGAEWTVSVPVAVKLPSGTERISGYRLLAFYP
jgi:predicted Zn finger-like uncharacterized protein